MTAPYRLIYGDAWEELAKLRPTSADLIVLDPGTSRDFVASRKRTHGPRQGAASIPDRAPWLDAFLAQTGRGAAFSEWVQYMHAIAIEAQRVLKATGNVIFETDVDDSATIRAILDSALGAANFRNEIVRRRGVARPTTRGFPTTTSRMLYYVASQEEAYFANERQEDQHRLLSEIVDQRGMPVGTTGPLLVSSDVWSFPDVAVKSPERLGVRGQDPTTLARRVVRTLSPPGGLVVDPFCGSGTFLAAAHKLDRRWLGVDNEYTAITTVKHRASLLGLGRAELVTVGEPSESTPEEYMSPQEFELRILGELGARPSSLSMREDRGFDGQIFRHVPGRNEPVRILVEVKAWQTPVGRNEVLALAGMLDLQGADMAVIVSRSGFSEAARLAAEDFGTTTIGKSVLPRLQAVDFRAILNHSAPLLPFGPGA